MFDEKLEKSLRGWARWWHDVESGNEGYPRKSSIAWFQDGLAVREEFKSIPLITNEKAQQVEVFLKKLNSFNPDYALAVMLQYLSNKSPNELAALLNISRRTFYQRLQGGLTWLSGYITRHETS